MKIAIIDYGAGNVQSVKYALEKLGYQGEITSDSNTIKNAEKVIFPGVGQAKSAMKRIKHTGLDKVIPSLTQPTLGICLGMQLLCNHTAEGNTKGLGVFDVDVVEFETKLNVPHMGWNSIESFNSTLFSTLNEKEHVYFVHSYYVPICEHTIARSVYEIPFSASLQRDNFYGCQFHPEKSSTVGMKILQKFIEL